MRDNRGQFSVRLGATERRIWRGCGGPGCRDDNCGSSGAPDIWASTYASLLGGFCLDTRVDPKFLPDVGEFQWTHELAASFRLQSPKPGPNRNVSLQDRCRPAASCPDSAQSADQGKNWLRRAQPDDDARHAGHRPNPLIRAARGDTQPAIHSCTKAGQGSISRANPVPDAAPADQAPPFPGVCGAGG
jgi:hypothetical protein